MAASLDTIHTFVLGNPKFKQRFAASRLQAAWDILGESNPSANRVAWRNKIFRDVGKDLDREYVWFLSHPSVQNGGDAITDGEVNVATKSFVDAWAALDAAGTP